ncbi:uncharacterized protein [Antedon mediterranea]|uniref:uncharacterized protein n=1 Tax=Antedon mediterranea TaxID=105859 RepID=UPI003AF66F3B
MALNIGSHRIVILLSLLSLICISECFVQTVEVRLPIKSEKSQSSEEEDLRGYCNGFTCGDSKCLPTEYVCDGEPDCSESEDESACNLNVCKEDQFACDNGDCIERSWACDMVSDCPAGDDEEDGLCDNRQCKENEFKCKSGSCINIEWQCDGQYDCYHSDDEVNCKSCTAQQFKCNDDTCIPESSVCNGNPECEGGEDEHQWCACTSGEFKCDSGICIPRDKLCDGNKDCGYSGEDEHDCESCDSDQYRCKGYSKCIPNSFVCDGLVEDCPNGDDESECGCTQDQFECSDGTCIAQSLVCDGTVHCSDDETTQCECEELEFDCNSPVRICLTPLQVCDGTPQCPNGDDEEGCPFTCGPPNNFLCPDGTCLLASVQCNGLFDCGTSRADEVGCKCTEDQFKCVSGECLSNQFVCNKHKDCTDGSDEFVDVCTPEPIVGECPNVPAGTIGLCVHGCGTDDDCQNEKRCCFNGCGKECVHPIFPPEPFVKDGECPVLSAPYGAQRCTDLCLEDSDCPNKEKCCSNGCGKVCAEPFNQPTNEVEEINTDEIEKELEQVKDQLSSLDTRFDWLERTVSDVLVELGILQTEITDLKNHEHYGAPAAPYHAPYYPPPAPYHPPPVRYQATTTKVPETPEPPQNVVNGYPTNTGSRPGYQSSPEHNRPNVNVGRPVNTYSKRPHRKRIEKKKQEKDEEFKRTISRWGQLLRSNDN